MIFINYEPDDQNLMFDWFRAVSNTVVSRKPLQAAILNQCLYSQSDEFYIFECPKPEVDGEKKVSICSHFIVVSSFAVSQMRQNGAQSSLLFWILIWSFSSDVSWESSSRNVLW
jgi:hypothetical protein